MNIFVVNMNDFVPCLPSMNGLQQQQARHLVFQKFCQKYGYGELSWFCPTCGKNDHGVPRGKGLSISTSTVEHWSALAIDRAGARFGFDLSPRRAPPEASGIANDLFSPSEQQLQPKQGWLYGSTFSEIWVRKEALGKMHGIGLMLDKPGEEGGILDSEKNPCETQFIMLNHSHGIPNQLIGCIATESKHSNENLNVKQLKSDMLIQTK